MPAAVGAGGTQFAGAQDRSGNDKPLTQEAGAHEVLAAERAHLAASREHLRLMREHVLSLPAMAGDRVSEEFLKADLYRRAEAPRGPPDQPAARRGTASPNRPPAAPPPPAEIRVCEAQPDARTANAMTRRRMRAILDV